MSRFLSGDTLLRAVSLGLALVLWVVIAGRYTAERGLTVPVELRNFPPGLDLTGDLVNSVNVRLRASPGLVESLDPGQVLVRIDLQGMKEGEHIFQLTSEHIEVPFGFRVVKITPSLLTINLERSLIKTLPVRPRILGQPAPGYEVEKVTSEPAEVRVRGPRSRIQEIESAFTEPVSVDGADVTVEEYVNVGLEDPLLNLESEESQEVKVVAHIRERQEERLYEGLPVIARGQPSRLSPSSVSAEVRGPARVLRDLDPDDLRPYVNVPSDHDGAHPLPVAVEIAPGHTGATVVRTEPAEVKARPVSPRRQP